MAQARFSSLGEWIQAQLAAHPGRPAVAEKRRYRLRTLTYRELDLRVRSCRRLLLDRGARPGDRVALLGPNSIAWAAAFLACVESGLIPVPLDLHSPPALVRAVLKQTEARFFVTSLPGTENVETVLFDELMAPAAAGSGEPLPPASAGPSDLLEIVYTSGTTGVPKGVMLTHAGLLANVEGVSRKIPLPIPVRFLSTLPLSHMFEQVLGLLYPLSQGGCVVYPDSLRPARLARFIRTYRVNGLVTVPGLLAGLKAALESGGRPAWRALGLQFRLIGVGGAALPEDLEAWWSARGLRVVQGFGMTEAGPLIAFNTPFSKRRACLGRPLPGSEVRLGPDGEIQVRGPQVTPGYWRLPEKTAQLFTPDGWLKTGDIGELRGGRLYFRGRLKDVIVTPAGRNVYPEDVEQALNKVPAVKDSCVFERRGKVWAALLLKEPAPVQPILDAANAGLMPHQKAAGAMVWPLGDFPRTPMGKVRKFQVLEELKRLEKRGAPPAPPGPSGDGAGSILSRLAGPRPVRPEDTLGGLGLDSLDRIELLSAIEQELGVELEETAVTERTTAGELAGLTKEGPGVPAVLEPLWPFSPPAELFRRLLGWLPRAVLLAVARPACAGAENLKGLDGPILLVANHQSAWDGGLIHHYLPPRLRRCVMPALTDFYGYGEPRSLLQRLALRAVGHFISLFYRAYPFGPGVGTERSFEFTGRLADRGYSILIFPEGGRTPDGAVHPFFAGVGVLATTLGLPVVPVRIEGMHELLPYPRYVVPRRWGGGKVAFGSPLVFDGGNAEEAARTLQKAVEELTWRGCRPARPSLL